MKTKSIKKIIVEISPYIFIALIMPVAFIVELGKSGDELWNYNFARNVVSGRLPYKDFNMVQTPV